MKSPFESEYFVREDAERIRKLAHALRKEVEASARVQRDAAHALRCPRCDEEMHEVVFRGMTVDVCAGCRGMFLDEPELAHLLPPPAPAGHGVMSGILNWFKPEVKL